MASKADTYALPTKLMNWNFVLLWQGQFVSFIGTQAFMISMIFWMKHETGSAAWVGLVTMATTLPGALLGPLGGAIADRYSRKGIILMTDFARGTISLALAALVIAFPDEPRLMLSGLLATAFLMGALGSFFRPAINAAIPDLVPPDKVTSANSLMGVSMNVSTFIGQVFGGVLFRLLGPALLFIFNGVSYIFSGISELFIKIPQKFPESSPSFQSVLADVRRDTVEGLRYIWAERGLTMILLTIVNDMVFLVAISILFPFFVEDYLEASPDWYGYLVATFAAGNALGALSAGVLKVGGRWRIRMIVAGGMMASGAGLLLGNIHSNWHALVLILVAGTFVGFNDIHMFTAIQLAVGSEMRGRVLGLFGTITLAATPIAAGMSGVATDLLKQDISMVYMLCGAGLGITPLIVLSSSRARSLLAYERGQASVAEGSAVTLEQREKEEKKMKRVVKWVAVGATVLLVVLMATIVYMVRRPWPMADGQVAVTGLRAPVEVIRDDWGIPHIYAENELDLFLAQGYVHAQDRLWQMHMGRVVAAGRLAELFGESVVETDRLLRVLSLRWAAARDWERLDEDLREILEAYSAGVNAYIEANSGHLGLEFRLLGVEPEPWTPIDTLTWTKVLSLNIGLNMSREVARVDLKARLGDELGGEAAERILARYPDDGPVIVSPAPASGPSPDTVARREVSSFGQTRQAGRAALRGLAGRGPWVDLLRLAGLKPDLSRFSPLLGHTPAWGSNAWVVHGSRTASGKPLLANDPHLGLGMPSVWYENGLHGGRFDVVGFSFPGLPAVVTGHNGSIAWGITSLASDTQDLFIEQLDDGENGPTRYRYRDEWRDLEVRVETIEVRGGEPEELRILSTHHGPLVNELFEGIRDQRPMALSWTALREMRLLRALVELNQARSWDEFRGALAFWDAPALSFVYADVAGNIGYQATGRHPIRTAGHDGSVPVPGWTGEHDWREFIPAAELPWAFNPPSGVVVTANNKTVSDDYPYHLTGDWADPSRAQRISDLLADGNSFTREDMARIQGDTYAVMAEELRPHLLAVEPSDALAERALREVRDWDLRYEADRIGAAVYYVWQWRLYRNIVADELGDPEKLEQDTAVVYQQHSPLDEIMARPDDPWFDDRTTPEVETREDIVRRSLADAVAWLVENHGDDPAAWRWGRLHPMVFTHQPLGQTGQSMIDNLFNSDPMEGRGGPFTVFATTPSLSEPFAIGGGTSQRFIADLADLGRSLAINSTGQCAHLFHRHREDQIPLWQDVEFHPVYFSRGSVEGAAESTLRLTPP